MTSSAASRQNEIETSAAGAAPLDSQSDLQTVLEAWHGATLRLEQTHQSLREEVVRLTHELEIKNRELARKNRLADLGQMAAHVAHEVRNNLMPVTLYLSSLRRRVVRDPQSIETVDKINAGVLALDAMVNDLLHFTADREPSREPVRLRQLIAEVCSSLSPQLTAQNIRAIIDVESSEQFLADTSMLRRAILNLALNALDAMPNGGSLWFTSLIGPHGLEVEVADSGPGMSDEARRRAFEPFYSTKSSGTGLGLAIVYRIAEAHGGDVRVANCPEGGAVVTLRIPFQPLRFPTLERATLRAAA